MYPREKLRITSPSFIEGGTMPKKHTGFDADISPAFQLENLCCEAVSIAVIMDDLDIPFIKEYTHWLIWNIPKTDAIPENIPHGETVSAFGNAVQGTAYGKNRFRGPKQPIFIRNAHRYIFRFYVLDAFIDLDGTAKKPALLKAMEGHILQTGSITGKYRR